MKKAIEIKKEELDELFKIGMEIEEISDILFSCKESEGSLQLSLLSSAIGKINKRYGHIYTIIRKRCPDDWFTRG